MDKKTTNDKMSDAMEFIEDFITKQVIDDFRRGNGIRMVLDAYNRMREDECGGTGYIFDIHKKEDLEFLVTHMCMSATAIAFVVNNPIKYSCGLFTLDEMNMMPVENITELLINSLNMLIPYVLLYVDRCKEYQEFYSRYFTDKVLQMDYFQN